MSECKHEFDQNVLHEPRCKCRLMQYSIAHAKELEARAEKAEAEVERVRSKLVSVSHDGTGRCWCVTPDVDDASSKGAFHHYYCNLARTMMRPEWEKGERFDREPKP